MCNLQQLTSPCEKNISEEFLSQCYLEGDDLLMNFNTASECWIYHYDPENKRRFMEYQTFCLTEWQLLPKGPVKPYEHSANTSAGLGLKKDFVLYYDNVRPYWGQESMETITRIKFILVPTIQGNFERSKFFIRCRN